MFRSADWRNITVSDEEEHSYNEDGLYDHPDAKRLKSSSGHLVKWTDDMVRLLITSMSYTVENLACEGGDRLKRNLSGLQKKEKWKSVSKVMAERGFRASPQQCEDKFNDMNQRYKKLNDMLGKGTSCRVVENPALLDVINYLTEEAKDEVRKILSSKQLFYEEMCSYHNGNRLHLPHDPALEHSLQMALTGRHEHDELEDSPEVGGEELGEKNETLGGFSKRARFLQLPDHFSSEFSKKQLLEYRIIKIKEQRIKLQMRMLEVERQSSEWRKFHQKNSHELEWMMIENEKMKYENEQMAAKLKRRNIDLSDVQLKNHS